MHLDELFLASAFDRALSATRNMARAKKATGAAGAAITLEHVASNQGSSADDGLNAVDAEGSDDSGADNSGGGVGHAADGNAKRAGGKGRRKIQIGERASQ